MTFGERLQTLILSEQISRQRLYEYLQHISLHTELLHPGQTAAGVQYASADGRLF